MFTNLSILWVFIIFILAAAVTWAAGVTLAKTTDTLDTRFKIGDAIGGLVLLGIAGSLPEIAVVYGAAIHNHPDIIIGTLIGGIAIQTLVLAIFDIAVKGKRPLSYLAGSLMLTFETTFAIVITVIALLGTFIPAERNWVHTNPMSIFLLIAWLVGLYLIDRARNNPKYLAVAEDADPGRKHHERRKQENHPFYKNRSTLHVALIFIFAAAVTLVAGYLLEETGNSIASHFGIGSGIFAATAIALVTALPEISTGLESVFIGDNNLAISDIMGGNAFMLIIFLFADLIAKKPILSFAGHQDILFAVLGIVMMSVYAISFIKRPKKRYFRLGLDSIFEILLYVVGLIVLGFVK